MKIFRFLSLTLAVCFSTMVFALAVETDPAASEVSSEETDETVTFDTVTDDKNITVNVTLPAQSGSVVEEDPASDEVSEEPSQLLSLYSTSDLDAVGEAEAGEETTMRQVITGVFGEYTPRTQTVTQYLSDGTAETHTEIVPGVAGMDWPWIAGVSLFCLVLFSFLKMVGVLLKNG